MDKLTGVGKISYALYLLHVPIAYFIKKTFFINNQPLEVVVKYSLWISITVCLAMVTELKLKPIIKRHLN